MENVSKRISRRSSPKLPKATIVPFAVHKEVEKAYTGTQWALIEIGSKSISTLAMATSGWQY